MAKFFIRNDQINENVIFIVGEDVNHIVNVLRMKKDDIINVCNQDTGANYMCEIVDYGKESVECKIKQEIESCHESNVSITLFQGLPKFDKMELIIQKNTEIGVKCIVPVKMERTIVKLDEKSKLKKVERWQKIAEIAAKQSMRDVVPKVEDVQWLKSVLEDFNKYDVVLVAYENEQDLTLKSVLKKIDKSDKYSIAIVIGPEGGISENELFELKSKSNVKVVSLGKRILRTETAALVMASNILYELEN